MNPELLESVKQHMCIHLDDSVIFTSIHQVYGGDINETFALQTNKGKFFLKLNSEIGKADMFQKEFNGLQLLRSAMALSVPEPILHGSVNNNIYLLLQHVEEGLPSADFWKHFGFGLAALHKQTDRYYGLKEDNYIGSLPQPNKRCTSWHEFYARRLLHLFGVAFNNGKCDNKDIVRAEQLCKRFQDLFPVEEPALLHGDLWSGNYMVNDDGEVVIYDPAVYYGHREMDIGMTLLFGGFDKSFFNFYNEAFPLEKHWQKRVELTQLYPLLVHLILFGGGYYTRVTDIVNRYA